jgi:type II protein arginine methyltransferase
MPADSVDVDSSFCKEAHRRRQLAVADASPSTIRSGSLGRKTDQDKPGIRPKGATTLTFYIYNFAPYVGRGLRGKPRCPLRLTRRLPPRSGADIRSENAVTPMNNVENGVSQAKDCMASLTWTERQFPTWHFSMLNDTTRNAIIENAIRELDLEDKIVFEIGAGTGLIAILFAKYGAKHVYTCESNRQLYDIARYVVARSGYANKVTLFPLSCRELIESRFLEEKPDIVFTETLDCGVVNEGFFQIAQDLASLTGGNAVALPQRIDQFGYLISSADIYGLNHVDAACGIDLSIINRLNTKTYYPIRLTEHEFQALTEVSKLRSYDYLKPERSDVELTFPIQVDGICHGLISWFEARFGRYVVSNDLHYRTHWHQAFHPLPQPVPLKAGTSCNAMFAPNGCMLLGRT